MTLVPGVLSVIAMMLALIVAVPGLGNDAPRSQCKQPQQDAAFNDVLEIFHGRVSDGTHSLILKEAGAAFRGMLAQHSVGFPRRLVSVALLQRGRQRTLEAQEPV